MTMPTMTFEFSTEQNALLSWLALRLRVVGIGLLVLAMLCGAVSAFAGLPFSAPGLIAALLVGACGYWSVRASQELQAVTATQGADIEHLMAALRRLGQLFNVQYWVVIAALLLLATTILVAQIR